MDSSQAEALLGHPDTCPCEHLGVRGSSGLGRRVSSGNRQYGAGLGSPSVGSCGEKEIGHLRKRLIADRADLLIDASHIEDVVGLNSELAGGSRVLSDLVQAPRHVGLSFESCELSCAGSDRMLATLV